MYNRAHGLENKPGVICQVVPEHSKTVIGPTATIWPRIYFYKMCVSRINFVCKYVYVCVFCGTDMYAVGVLYIKDFTCDNKPSVLSNCQIFLKEKYLDIDTG